MNYHIRTSALNYDVVNRTLSRGIWKLYEMMKGATKTESGDGSLLLSETIR